jgi:7,8-dihydropterin-6-yl-methyl-4-(beta-D-ribofuranosyl)aminobenzene 5'-phosphate synthase
MKRFYSFCLLLATALALTSFHVPKLPEKMESPKNITLTILYDNYKYDEGFRNSWGFSCLIEGSGQTILFDTGGDDGNLMHNFRAAGKDPRDVDMVILSHIHGDHTGGLMEFLESRSGIKVYMPQSFPEDFQQEIADRGAHPVAVGKAKELADNVWSTGEMGRNILEQSLVVETPGGLVIITGCAHPGIEDIVSRALEINKKPVLLVMGGFHLLRTGKNAVEEIAKEFKEMPVTYAAPTHCSGDGTLKIFRDVFGERYLKLGTGRVIKTAALYHHVPVRISKK